MNVVFAFGPENLAIRVRVGAGGRWWGVVDGWFRLKIRNALLSHSITKLESYNYRDHRSSIDRTRQPYLQEHSTQTLLW